MGSNAKVGRWDQDSQVLPLSLGGERGLVVRAGTDAAGTIPALSVPAFSGAVPWPVGSVLVPRFLRPSFPWPLLFASAFWVTFPSVCGRVRPALRLGLGGAG